MRSTTLPNSPNFIINKVLHGQLIKYSKIFLGFPTTDISFPNLSDDIFCKGLPVSKYKNFVE